MVVMCDHNIGECSRILHFQDVMKMFEIKISVYIFYLCIVPSSSKCCTGFSYLRLKDRELKSLCLGFMGLISVTVTNAVEITIYTS